MASTSPPPLTGLRVLELGGLAPGPFCGLLLSSYGASVLRIDRPGPSSQGDLLTQSKSCIALDLKAPTSLSLFTSLVTKCDVLIDPFRPGVLEKLGLNPRDLLTLNPRLIVVRLTGFRRDGKYKDMAGHDINYLAVSGVLSMLGTDGQRPPEHPGNILADFAGGGMVAFTGVLLALIERQRSGKGQIVEANMVDGVGFLGTFPRLGSKTAIWDAPRGTNTLDGGAPYYGCYETKDRGKYVSVGALEPQFFHALLKGLGLRMEDVVPPTNNGEKRKLTREDKAAWPYMKKVFTRTFKTKTRKEWEDIFDGTDACVAPVLEMKEMEDAGYEQRPIVGLTSSPANDVEMAWKGRPLAPGQGGAKVLREWLGWEKGRDFDADERGALGALNKSGSRSKL